MLALTDHDAAQLTCAHELVHTIAIRVSTETMSSVDDLCYDIVERCAMVAGVHGLRGKLLARPGLGGKQVL